MATALLNGLLKLFFYIVSLLGSILFVPVQTLLELWVPSLGNYFDMVESFFEDTLVDYLVWIRVSVCNLMCFDHQTWLIFATWIMSFILIAPSVRLLKAIYNLYKTVKGTYNK